MLQLDRFILERFFNPLLAHLMAALDCSRYVLCVAALAAAAAFQVIALALLPALPSAELFQLAVLLWIGVMGYDQSRMVSDEFSPPDHLGLMGWARVFSYVAVGFFLLHIVFGALAGSLSTKSASDWLIDAGNLSFYCYLGFCAGRPRPPRRRVAASDECPAAP